MTEKEIQCRKEILVENKCLNEENAELSQKFNKAASILKKDIYSMAIEKYGKTSQCIIAMEEMSELIKELSKNYRGCDNITSVSEEMADVEIMFEQLKLIFNNRAEVDILKADKLYRLSERIFTESKY